jgi:glycosyltransferase involved in cell wall biosynthesis
MYTKSVTHLTSVHPRYDTRIFFKECVSLAKDTRYQVNLVVADSLGDETKHGVSIYDVGKESSRIRRVRLATKRVLAQAIALKSQLYHIHDPELIPVGLKLKKMGKRVIFDIHEHISLQIKDKTYLNVVLRHILSKVYAFYEQYALRKFDYLVLAETSYEPYYRQINRTVTVLNMPDIHMLKPFYSEEREENGMFYIGGISNERGLDTTIEMVQILKEKIPDIHMHYVGHTYSDILKHLDIADIKEHITFYGPLPLTEGMILSKKAKVGLSILKPLANYQRSYSTKVFEYMAIGLPVVTSNFPLYKEIIEKYGCGICVDPLNPKEAADAVERIVTSPQEAHRMSQNGIRAVNEHFNWEIEKGKLLKVYDAVLEGYSDDA